MNIRTRMITLASALLVAISIAPQSAIAAKPSKPSNPLIWTAPYSSNFFNGYCTQAGTGVCAAEATAADATGRVTVSGTASATQSSLPTAQTGTALAIPYSGVTEYFRVPQSGASSITFTVTAHINSAEAQAAAAGNSYAVLFFHARANVFGGSCTDCTGTVSDVIVTSYSAPASVGDRTFTFVVRSASGQRLRGQGYISIQLVGNARVDEGPLPLIATSSSAHVEGDATLRSVTATLVN